MLRGTGPGDMWRMLLSRAPDLEVQVVETRGTETEGSASWIARYTFSRTGRRVNNHVTSLFAFRDGLIVRQVDSFGFWRWARDALGPLGVAFGWFPPLKWKIRRDAARALETFSAARRDPGSESRRTPG
jgi:uncharacterized protein